MEVLVKILATVFVAMSFVIKANSIGCPAPPLLAGTNYTKRDVSVFTPGNQIIYSCSFGFVEVGLTTRTCNADGTWTGTDRVCRINAASLVVACGAGLFAILVFTVLSCFLISRRRQAKRRQERRLTIQKEGGIDGPGGNADGFGETADGSGGPMEHAYQLNGIQKYHVERSDSGLAPDADLEGIDMNDFDMHVESPTDNNPPETEEWDGI